jgi:hypothetical protein
MFLAFNRHSPDDTAIGLGDTAREAAQALIDAAPFCQGRELSVVNFNLQKGADSLEEMPYEIIVIGERLPKPAFKAREL